MTLGRIDPFAARIEPGEQLKGSLGVRTSRLGDEQFVNSLPWEIQEAAEFGLFPITAQFEFAGTCQVIPKRGVWTGSK